MGGGLSNEIGVDWFALDGAPSFQKTMEDMGYVSVMDLEGPGAQTKASETLSTSTLMKNARFGIPIAILGGILAFMTYQNKKDASEDGE